MNKNFQVWILIAAYNEEKTIGKVVKELINEGYKVLVVDDGSTDRTGEIAKKEGVIVLRHVINRGKGAALVTGTDYLIKKECQIIVHFDADGQHNAKDVKLLIKPIIENKADVVFGSRFLGTVENMPIMRRMVLKFGIMFTNLMLNIKLTDVHNGLRAFSRNAFMKIKLTEDRFAYASELIEEVVKNKLTFCEVPVNIVYTDYSINKGQKNLNAINILFRAILRRLRS